MVTVGLFEILLQNALSGKVNLTEAQVEENIALFPCPFPGKKPVVSSFFIVTWINERPAEEKRYSNDLASNRSFLIAFFKPIVLYSFSGKLYIRS